MSDLFSLRRPHGPHNPHDAHNTYSAASPWPAPGTRPASSAPSTPPFTPPFTTPSVHDDMALGITDQYGLTGWPLLVFIVAASLALFIVITSLGMGMH